MQRGPEVKNDDAYDNGGHIPDSAGFIERWAIAAREFREVEAAVGRARLNHPYGQAERNRLDLFHPAGRPAGLVVLIHGGYWRRFGREDFSHLARGATQAGWAVALPSYTLAPAATIHEITAEIAAAVTAAAALVAGPIAVTGHSAGGHLAARMLCRDVALPVRDRITACVPVSPLSVLAPLIETTMNADLGLDAATAAAESPALSADVAAVPVTVRVGGAERPAFLDQARWLTKAWPHATLDIVPGLHHFDIIDAYEDPASTLVAALTRP